MHTSPMFIYNYQRFDTSYFPNFQVSSIESTLSSKLENFNVLSNYFRVQSLPVQNTKTEMETLELFF